MMRIKMFTIFGVLFLVFQICSLSFKANNHAQIASRNILSLGKAENFSHTQTLDFIMACYWPSSNVTECKKKKYPCCTLVRYCKKVIWGSKLAFITSLINLLWGEWGWYLSSQSIKLRPDEYCMDINIEDHCFCRHIASLLWALFVGLKHRSTLSSLVYSGNTRYEKSAEPKEQAETNMACSNGLCQRGKDTLIPLLDNPIHSIGFLHGQCFLLNCSSKPDINHTRLWLSLNKNYNGAYIYFKMRSQPVTFFHLCVPSIYRHGYVAYRFPSTVQHFLDQEKFCSYILLVFRSYLIELFYLLRSKVLVNCCNTERDTLNKRTTSDICPGLIVQTSNSLKNVGYI